MVNVVQMYYILMICQSKLNKMSSYLDLK